MRSTADILIKGGTVLTMDPTRKMINDGALAISGNKIEAVGTSADITTRFEASKVIDARGKLVMPGLVNPHTHVLQVLLRGLAHDRELYPFLFNVLFPGLSQYTPDDARLAATLYCAEAIRSGITTIVDNGDQGRDDALAVATIDTYRQVGIRAVYARMFNDTVPDHLAKHIETIMHKESGVNHPADVIEDTEEALSQIESLIQRFHMADNGRIRVWASPFTAQFTTEKGLIRSAELAEKYNSMTAIHLAESHLDASMYGMTPTEYLHSIGFLSPRILAAHCVWLTEKDIRLFQIHDVKAAHNVICNHYIASGVAPVAKMTALGITVGLGTDDANVNDSVNMFQSMKIAALAQRAKYLDASVLTTEKVVEMATIDGARSIGMESEIGSLEPGKKADVILIDLNHPQFWPLNNIPSALVFQAYGSEVETTIVDGRILMEDRKLNFLGTDETFLYQQAQKASIDIATKARLTDLTRGWRRLGS
ncbi:amidohydrolase family protein [Cohnella silvisoli]|uniref:Amidohydrolase n=1 Tax=Cohnella silvisoli TaxID=2873699 RepID=A0ABV1KUR3_9BACL|nr:amidohydrolase [Cohnella silvisoli]MCD9022957.1 amidohydrolase [Cohnella silvisoli]